MIKPFVTFSMLLVFILMGVSLHYLFSSSNEHSQKLKEIVSLTSYTNLSISQEYDATPSNATYPEMAPLGRMDFVYEQ